MPTIAMNERQRFPITTVFDTAANPKVVQKGPVTSITRVGTTATVTRPKHNYVDGQTVLHSGADQAAYNISAAISNVTADTYDYTVAGSPATPATHAGEGIFASDIAQSKWMVAPSVIEIESIAGGSTVLVEVSLDLARGWKQLGASLDSSDDGSIIPIAGRYNFVRLRRSVGAGAVKAHAL